MNKEVRIKVRLSEEENEELKRCAGACGMSQSEFIRQLCKGKTPKPKPTKEFWELLNTLYSVHMEQMDGEEFPLTLGKQIKKTRQALHALGTAYYHISRLNLKTKKIELVHHFY